ncbi:8616_t:CDS:2, partial [Dentiscutata erythropus]
IAKQITEKQISLDSEFEIIGVEASGDVDYAFRMSKINSSSEELVCITEAKRFTEEIGIIQNIVQLESAFYSNKKQKNEDIYENFKDYYDYLYASEWYFIMYALKKIYLSERYLIEITLKALNERSEKCHENNCRLVEGQREVTLEVSVPSTSIFRNTELGKSVILAGGYCQNTHKKKDAEKIIQLIADSIQSDAQSGDKITTCDEIPARPPCQDSSIVLLLFLAQLFDKATDAEYGVIRANQEEILHWYYYREGFLIQVRVVIQDGNGKIDKKRQRG